MNVIKINIQRRDLPHRGTSLRYSSILPLSLLTDQNIIQCDQICLLSDLERERARVARAGLGASGKRGRAGMLRAAPAHRGARAGGHGTNDH